MRKSSFTAPVWVLEESDVEGFTDQAFAYGETGPLRKALSEQLPEGFEAQAIPIDKGRRGTVVVVNVSGSQGRATKLEPGDGVLISEQLGVRKIPGWALSQDDVVAQYERSLAKLWDEKAALVQELDHAERDAEERGNLLAEAQVGMAELRDNAGHDLDRVNALKADLQKAEMAAEEAEAEVAKVRKIAKSDVKREKDKAARLEKRVETLEAELRDATAVQDPVPAG